ncbi:MAG: translation elongation factor G [Candidatus Portnoybacteria bacterium RBG_19FT_COMBO_36_7]|uniref:Elongation factor G n=1 Tax=Candidatus Portnoybacteria bacterium RBG_19FT_COMBO_36_7 TaxID=1801992 RepID=A0A1G2F8W3_9BACT|nr:MAG: translation elongation factor G [Candidatus Portnoybacteria bacterium RBG_19FT_COMBO_36_7]
MPRQFTIEKIRNIGTIAHIDAGKTTVTEGILYLTGKTHKIGAVHEGETQMDWMDQEKERGITITAAATSCFWKVRHYQDVGEHQINIIDTPGHIDFTVEVQRSLRVLDGAVVIFDGKMGVEPQSETVWHQADKYNIPRLCFINKINQTGGDFYKSLNSIKERLSSDACPVQIPVGFEKDIIGVVDLVKMKTYTYSDFHDKELKEGEIPPDLKEKAEKFRKELIEKVVEIDNDLTEKYLEGHEISEAELVSAIRKNTLTGKFFPVMGGDGRGVIVETILDAVINYLPSPTDVPDIVGIDPKTEKPVTKKAQNDESFSALAFKIATDPFVGSLTFFRVYSGILKAGSYVLNTATGNKERIGRIVRMHANDRAEIQEVYPGDIAAAVGLKNTGTGDTICDPGHPVILEKIEFPEPVISIAIEPKTKADQEKMGIALRRLAEEDPTFRIKGDQETGETIISGMGELHLEIIVDRMLREFKVEANIGRPQVAYKETIKGKAEAEGKYIRQTGGHGQYGHVWLKVEARARGEGFEFLNEIKGGIIPQEFIPAIKKGVQEAIDKGVLAGYPLVDLQVVLYDGSFHEVDSSEIAFKIAASMALQEATRRAKLCLLEPVMKLQVITPEQFMGDVIGDINSKRGQIEDIEERGQDLYRVKVINAKVSLAEMFGYATSLRSMTQGRATFTMEFNHYAEVPNNIAQQIVEGKRK